MSKELFSHQGSRVLKLIRETENEPGSVTLEPEGEETVRVRLKEAWKRLCNPHIFKPGDLVSWKPHLRNKRMPESDKPAIVVEKLSNPIYSAKEDSGSAYFREPLDLVIGVIDDDGDFIVLYNDSRRFQPYS